MQILSVRHMCGGGIYDFYDDIVVYEDDGGGGKFRP